MLSEDGVADRLCGGAHALAADVGPVHVGRDQMNGLELEQALRGDARSGAEPSVDRSRGHLDDGASLDGGQQPVRAVLHWGFRSGWASTGVSPWPSTVVIARSSAGGQPAYGNSSRR